MISDIFILSTARSRSRHVKTSDSHYIFHQIFSYDIIFYHGQVKNHPCFLGYDKSCIRVKIPSPAFLAIAVTITLLTNRCSTKNSLLRQEILMMLQSVLEQLKLLIKHFPLT